MARSNKTDNTHFDQVNEASGKLELQKAESLKIALDFRLERQKSLGVEIERLTLKYGKDHVFVQGLAEKKDSEEDMIRMLELQIKLSKTQPEAFDPAWWRVQGFVYGSQGSPLSDLIVHITTSEKPTSAKSPGSSVTDEFGFYSISVKEINSQENQQEKVFLQVSDKNKRKWYDFRKALTPVQGQIDFECIFIKENK